MVIDDVAQHRKQLTQRLAVVRHGRISPDRMEKPQGCVGGVIQPLTLAVGKHVGNEAVAHVAGEGSQNQRGFLRPTGHERQPFEADHGVAAPVGKPVVAGDHRAGFKSQSGRARGLLRSGGRRHEKLIRCEHEFRTESALHRPGRLSQEASTACDFALVCRRGTERLNRLPRFSRRDDRGVAERRSIAKIDVKKTRTPQRALVLVPSRLLFRCTGSTSPVRRASAATGRRKIASAGWADPLRVAPQTVY